MNRAEFTDWFNYHSRCFTGITSWLQKFPTEARAECDVTRSQVRSVWEKALLDVSYDAARSATDALYRGDETKPASYDDHPRAIRSLAFRLSQRERSPSPSGADGHCDLCRGVGFVSCYHPRSLAAMRKGNLWHRTENPTGEITMTECAAICPCGRIARKGSRYDERTDLRTHPEHVGYDEKWHYLREQLESVDAEISCGVSFDPTRPF